MTTHTIKATPEAQFALEAYFNDIVVRRRNGELADVQLYAARWCEQAARLALVLHAGIHGPEAHLHPLALATAQNGIQLAKFYSAQQLNLLAKGRQATARKLEDEVLELVDSNYKRKHQDFITARDVHRARIVATAETARSLLDRMERDSLLSGQDVVPQHGGKTTRIYRRHQNPLPE